MKFFHLSLQVYGGLHPSIPCRERGKKKNKPLFIQVRVWAAIVRTSAVIDWLV
jgi:hypothetical protein